ncbi:butyrate kinase [Heliorestis convoluta]|nr:butyrate kinase [Heliorestis convoluta]
MKKAYKVLVINPGATSTKIALYEDEKVLLSDNIRHATEDLSAYKEVIEQLPYRLQLILDRLSKGKIAMSSIDAVVGRGGLLKPLQGGTYRVNAKMLQDLKQALRGEHASNLGALLAYHMALPLKKEAYIVDPVSVDELNPLARLSGWPELPRTSLSHVLNSKAVARKVAAAKGKKYEEMQLIVVHLGTGISVSAHQKGQIIDVNNAMEEGPFSIDRTGTLPARALVQLCYSGKYEEKDLLAKMSRSAGLFAYLGTKDLQEVERRIIDGDEEAELVFKSMLYQTAKEIGAMATVLSGQVEAIVFTGGMAHSDLVIQTLRERVSFIAPTVVYAGEMEMEALAFGALRVLRGEEEALVY